MPTNATTTARAHEGREERGGKKEDAARFESSRVQTVFIKSPSGIPHSPPQKSGLYISGAFKETGSFTPSVALSHNSNRT